MQKDAGSTPVIRSKAVHKLLPLLPATLGRKALPAGVIGNTSGSGPGECRFDPCAGSGGSSAGYCHPLSRSVTNSVEETLEGLWRNW